ncbi:MAG: hypothetical protein R3F05_00160 [Planctomycetota bacterium]
MSGKLEVRRGSRDVDFLAELDRRVLTEREFTEGMTLHLTSLEQRVSIRAQIEVSAAGAPLALYGAAGEGQPIGLDTATRASLLFRFSFWSGVPRSTPGGSRFDSTRRELVDELLDILEPHWMGRQANDPCINSSDPDQKARLDGTLRNAIRKGNECFYVGLDLNGIGELKELVGEVGVNKVIEQASNWLWRRLSDEFLLAHPHGDEYALIAVNRSPVDLLRRLADCQDELDRMRFTTKEEEAQGHRIGVKMRLVKLDSDSADWDSIVDQASDALEVAAFKGEADKRFIKIVDNGRQTLLWPVDEQELRTVAASARSGIASEPRHRFDSACAAYLAERLCDSDSTDTFEELATLLADELTRLRIMPTCDGPYVGGSCAHGAVALSAQLHPGLLVETFLYAVLRRRLLGIGPVQPEDHVYLEAMPTDGECELYCYTGTASRVCILRVPTELTARVVVDAGPAWVSGGGAGVVRRLEADTSFQPGELCPTLLVGVGDAGRHTCRPLEFASADSVYLDDRPVISGLLPDFWQSNVARIIKAALANPNVRTIVVSIAEKAAAAGTLRVLEAGTVAERGRSWDEAARSRIARATALPVEEVLEFQRRSLRLHVVSCDPSDVREAVLDALFESGARMSCLGEVPRAESPATATKAIVGATGGSASWDMAALTLSEAYPMLLGKLRKTSATSASGRSMTEVQGFRLAVAHPNQDPIPQYWVSEKQQFDAYYSRAFDGPDSFFGRRIQRFGAVTGGDSPGIDQLNRAVDDLAAAIQDGQSTRRVLMMVSDPSDPQHPLGLAALHFLPRERTGTWHLDCVAVWRSVEAIVGLPFSAYGSSRYMAAVADLVSTRVSALGLPPVAPGVLTYLALSLHLFADTSDLAIARQIELACAP